MSSISFVFIILIKLPTSKTWNSSPFSSPLLLLPNPTSRTSKACKAQLMSDNKTEMPQPHKDGQVLTDQLPSSHQPSKDGSITELTTQLHENEK